MVEVVPYQEHLQYRMSPASRVGVGGMQVGARRPHPVIGVLTHS